VDWLKNNVGGVRQVIMVPRGKLFFPEEHPKLMSVLLEMVENAGRLASASFGAV
jgi:hypothetical protein